MIKIFWKGIFNPAFGEKAEPAVNAILQPGAQGKPNQGEVSGVARSEVFLASKESEVCAESQATQVKFVTLYVTSDG